MESIFKFKVLNQLKSVYRFNSVLERKESSAEHTWSCLMLADYFISKFNYELDKVKVYELLMYHDVVEIEAGDTPLSPKTECNDKKEREFKAAQVLKEKLPLPLNEAFYKNFEEFEMQQTMEAKFAKAIDALDALIHEIDYKEDWKGWSKEFLIDKKAKYFELFPEIKNIFYQSVEYLEQAGYFEQ